MSTFVWKGVHYPSIEDMTFGEIRSAEKFFGEPGHPRNLGKFTETEQAMMGVYVAVKRVDVKAISWEELEMAGPEDLQMIEDPEPVAPEMVADPLDDATPTEVPA